MLPGNLIDDTAVLQQLLAVQDLVEALLKSEFSTRLPSSGFAYSGFEQLLSELAPVMGLLLSVGECPTLEQIISEEKDLPEGGFFPVTFGGQKQGATGEWLFVSDIKPLELPFAKIAPLRLRPNNDLLLGPIAESMNRTLMPTKLDVAGVIKLIIRVRCVLRNVQGHKLGFSH